MPTTSIASTGRTVCRGTTASRGRSTRTGRPAARRPETTSRAPTARPAGRRARRPGLGGLSGFDPRRPPSDGVGTTRFRGRGRRYLFVRTFILREHFVIVHWKKFPPTISSSRPRDGPGSPSGLGRRPGRGAIWTSRSRPWGHSASALMTSPKLRVDSCCQTPNRVPGATM